jgi:hypothetical protein
MCASAQDSVLSHQSPGPLTFHRRTDCHAFDVRSSKGGGTEAIAKIESPNANVRLETLERVAAALALDVDLNPIPRQPEQGAA